MQLRVRRRLAVASDPYIAFRDYGREVQSFTCDDKRTTRKEPGDQSAGKLQGLRWLSLANATALYHEVGPPSPLPDPFCLGRRRQYSYVIDFIISRRPTPNPKLAHSQCTGGMVGGIGMALLEQTVLDPRDGRQVNASMADYLVPVNLDIGTLEAAFVEENDPHVNPLGVKGLGEIALIGMAPAVANAVYHATGRRVRELPIRIESLLSS